MQFGRYLLSYGIPIYIVFFAATFAMAQTETATVSGLIVDSSGAIVRRAEVELHSMQRGTNSIASTNDAGIYSFTGVQPGQYSVTVRKSGFKQVDLVGIVANVQDHIEQNFKLEVGSVAESVTVEAGDNNINTTDASVGTVVDHQFVDNIPMNGRSFQSLVLLSPGTVTNNPNATSQGEYSVNGQRSDSNGFTVDGASASNPPAGASNAGTSAMLPSATTLGTTQAMLMVDAMEEFRISTSTYSAEYGSHPGAQISFRSRSGTNEDHGTLYDYFRNSVFDANNWFNTYSTTPVPTPAERQNDFGGTLGGPLSIPHLYSGTDRTFFFLAYEGLRLDHPQASSIYYVPSNGTYNNATYSDPEYMNLRQYAPAALDAFLASWPLPNCDTAIDPQCVDYGDGGSPYIASPPSSGKINSLSGRVDYQFRPTMRLFARYNDTTSNTMSVSTGGPYTSSQSGRNQVYLLGADNTFGGSISNQLRLQYAPASIKSIAAPAQVGGAAPFSFFDAQGMQPVGETYVRIYLPNESSNYDENFGTLQFQPSGTEALTWTHGKHLFKFGASYLQTTAYYADGTLSRSPSIDYHFDTAATILTNKTTDEEVLLYVRQDPTFKQLGLFAQDEWHLFPGLSLSLGLRWELAPPPSISGVQMYTYTGNINDPSTLGISSKPGGALYKTTYTDFAPRFGMAYVVHNQPGHELVLRAGGGLFYETIELSGFAPNMALGTSRTLTYNGDPFPVTPSQVNQPILPPTAPYNVISYPNNSIVPPSAIEWNVSLEQALGPKQTLTMGYVASQGRKLTTYMEYSMSKVNNEFGNFDLYSNGPGSSYNSLQVKYQRQMSHGLQALASYSWAHSLDWASSDTGTYPLQKGNSDNDIRHNFTAAAVYNLPSSYENRLVKTLLGYWNADLWFVARTAFPYEPQGPAVTDPVTGDVIFGELNYNGKNPYVYKPGIPGGRQIDPTIFSVTTAPLGVGSAPRNFLRAFEEGQANVAIQRDFPLSETTKLQFRAEGFNMTNHPNFGNVNLTCGVTAAGSTCNNTLMGQATTTLNSGLGNLNSLYQQGGPRSLEFMLRVQF